MPDAAVIGCGPRRRVGEVVVYMGSSNLKRDIPLYAQMSLAGRFNLKDLVSKEISLGEIDEAYEALKDGSIARVVITDFDS
jgi:S-(hydroxymethyl)glutathione dehydrogenase/alcohol dehydrogenase